MILPEFIVTLNYTPDTQRLNRAIPVAIGVSMAVILVTFIFDYISLWVTRRYR